jgi:hypothetical protein
MKSIFNKDTTIYFYIDNSSAIIKATPKMFKLYSLHGETELKNWLINTTSCLRLDNDNIEFVKDKFKLDILNNICLHPKLL